jgi:hypothetical protein
MSGRIPGTLLPLALAALLGGCGEPAVPTAPEAHVSAETSAATHPPPPPAAIPAVEVADACSLLTQEEVESAGGRKALAPRGELMAELSSCSWGDPESPKMGDRPLLDVVELTAFSGSHAYYGGPDEQVRDLFSMARGNARGDEAVSGLGDAAYWDGRALHVLRVPYMLDITVDPESRAAAEILARAALARLP